MSFIGDISSPRDLVLNLICPTVGCIICSVQYSSSIQVILEARRLQNLGSINPIPLAATFILCLVWLIYGALLGSFFYMLSVFIGLVTSFFATSTAMNLLGIAGRHAALRIMEKIIIPTFGVFSFIFLLQTTGLLGYDLVVEIFGNLCLVSSLLYGLSPLSSIVNIVKEKDASSLHAPSIFVTMISSLLWIGYGIGLNNINGIIPSSWTFVCCCIQLYLKCVYRNSPKKEAENVALLPTLGAAAGVEGGEGIPMNNLPSDYSNTDTNGSLRYRMPSSTKREEQLGLGLYSPNDGGNSRMPLPSVDEYSELATNLAPPTVGAGYSADIESNNASGLDTGEEARAVATGTGADVTAGDEAVGTGMSSMLPMDSPFRPRTTRANTLLSSSSSRDHFEGYGVGGGTRSRAQSIVDTLSDILQVFKPEVTQMDIIKMEMEWAQASLQAEDDASTDISGTGGGRGAAAASPSFGVVAGVQAGVSIVMDAVTSAISSLPVMLVEGGNPAAFPVVPQELFGHEEPPAPSSSFYNNPVADFVTREGGGKFTTGRLLVGGNRSRSNSHVSNTVRSRSNSASSSVMNIDTVTAAPPSGGIWEVTRSQTQLEIEHHHLQQQEQQHDIQQQQHEPLL